MPSKQRGKRGNAGATGEKGGSITALESIYSLSIWKHAAMVFAAGFLTRIILDLLFFSAYGWHAVNHLETWFYYAVSKGIKLPAGGILDPTVWILQFGGMILPGELSFYYVVAMSAVLSSLTAVAVYLLAREHYGIRTGLAAGLIYALMVQPIALSLVGFTHDHLQMLLFVLTILSAVKAVKNSGRARLAYAIAFILLVYNGLHINPVIWIAAGISVLYAAGIFIKEKAGESAYETYFNAMLVCFTLGVILMLPSLIGELTDLPQGRMGSLDVTPINLSNFWLRFNVLLTLLPLALVEAYRKRDLNAINITIAGVILSAVMDRGARILDVGIAILTANMAFSLKKEYKWYLAALTVAAFAFFLTQTNASIGYNVVFIAAALAIAASAFILEGEKRALAVITVVLLVGFTTNLVYVYTIDPRKITPEVEYDTYKWLATQEANGKVLVGWDHGYYLETISGHLAVSTPNRIEYGVHDALWLPERHAALKLKKAGVEYIVISDRNFNIVKTGSTYSFAINGGLLLEPSKVPPIELVKDIAVYKLRNDEASPEYFEKAFERSDDRAGIRFTVYKVAVKESIQDNENPVTVYFMNQGIVKTVKTKVGLTDGKNIFAQSYNTTLKADVISNELYFIEGKTKGSLNCSATIEPLGGEEWGYSGSMTYVNNGTAGDYNVIMALIDTNQSMDAGKIVTEDKRSIQVHLDAGEKKTVYYAFQKRYPSHKYMVAQSKSDNLIWVENESAQPSNQNARVLYAFC